MQRNSNQQHLLSLSLSDTHAYKQATLNYQKKGKNAERGVRVFIDTGSCDPILM